MRYIVIGSSIILIGAIIFVLPLIMLEANMPLAYIGRLALMIIGYFVSLIGIAFCFENKRKEE